jgi:NADH-quinone oxidoreductase subunit B
MLIDAILKLHAQIGSTKLGPHAVKENIALEAAALSAMPTSDMKGLLR